MTDRTDSNSGLAPQLSGVQGDQVNNPNLAALPYGKFERKMALRYIRARKTPWLPSQITFICFLAISLAVAILIVVMSVMNGFRHDLLSRMLGFQGHIYVDVNAISANEADDLLEQIRRLPDVTSASMTIENLTLASAHGKSEGVLARGILASDLEVMGEALMAQRGGERRNLRFVNDEALNAFSADSADYILLGFGLAYLLGPDDGEGNLQRNIYVGEEVTLLAPTIKATPFGSVPTRKKFKVGGFFWSDHSEYDSRYLFMPISMAQKFFGRGLRYDHIEIRIKDFDRTEPVLAQLQKLLPKKVSAVDWKNRNKSIFNALGMERVVMRLILFAIVVVAALAIAAGLVMLVSNKIRDIAVLRTMGATKSSIWRIFQLVGTLIGVIGIIVGILLSLLICAFIPTIDGLLKALGIDTFNSDVYFLSQLPVRMEMGEVATVAAGAFVICVLATLLPAWRASRLDPVEALRYE